MASWRQRLVAALTLEAELVPILAQGAHLLGCGWQRVRAATGPPLPSLAPPGPTWLLPLQGLQAERASLLGRFPITWASPCPPSRSLSFVSGPRWSTFHPLQSLFSLNLLTPDPPANTCLSHPASPTSALLHTAPAPPREPRWSWPRPAAEGAALGLRWNPSQDPSVYIWLHHSV